MKTTIYELLGMIKDGKAPKRIVFKNNCYEWFDDDKEYITETHWLFDEYVITDILNEEVEILETTITYNQDDYIQYQPYTGEVTLKPQEPTPYEPYTPPKEDKIEKLEQRIDTGLIGSESLNVVEHANRINRQAGYISDIVVKINEIIDHINEEVK